MDDFSKRLMDLAIGRVYKTLYTNLQAEEKLEAGRIFESGNYEEKEKFVKKYLPNFEKKYKEELKKLEEELKQEIQQ
jgi:hypothetical protein